MKIDWRENKLSSKYINDDDNSKNNDNNSS